VLSIAAGTGVSGLHTVELNHLVDTLTLVGAPDVLDGGDDNDTVIGDNSLTVAGAGRRSVRDAQCGRCLSRPPARAGQQSGRTARICKVRPIV
jgi:hypothetical protein